jgi:hypothetical protein
MGDEMAAKVAELAAANPENIALQSFDGEYYAGLAPELQTRLLACLSSGIENPDSQVHHGTHPLSLCPLAPMFDECHCAERGGRRRRWAATRCSPRTMTR